MAQTQLADVYVPAVFAGIEQEMNTQMNKLWVSGIVVDSPAMRDVLSPGGKVATLSGYNPITIAEPTYMTDNPASSITPAKITQAEQRFRIALRAQAWSEMQLARDLALQDPHTAILNRIFKFWESDNNNRLIKSCLGILADSVASHSSDMLYSVATDAVGAVTDAERISATNVINAWATMGDHAEDIVAIGMHSSIYFRLQKQNLITFVPYSDGKVQIPTYLGKIVIYDDQFPKVFGTNRYTYTCILFGRGVFGHTNAVNPIASEVYRLPLVGDGAGQNYLISRRNDALHCFGMDFTSATISGGSTPLSANYADLVLATNWDRIWDRKNIPLAFLQVND
jgi:hypothetical protein